MQTAPIKPLKPYFQVIEDVGDHIDWSQFFGNDNPVELDIGCGRGLFTYTAATNNPDVNYLGLEIDYREGRRAATRLLKREMPNARIIGGDGNVVLTKLIDKHRVQAAHVYFPDPWWKNGITNVGFSLRIRRYSGRYRAARWSRSFVERCGGILRNHQRPDEQPSAVRNRRGSHAARS